MRKFSLVGLKQVFIVSVFVFVVIPLMGFVLNYIIKGTFLIEGITSPYPFFFLVGQYMLAYILGTAIIFVIGGILLLFSIAWGVIFPEQM